MTPRRLLTAVLFGLAPSLVAAPLGPLDKSTFRALQLLQFRHKAGPYTLAEATQLRKAILQDNQVSPAEQALLEVLKGPGNFAVTISGKQPGFDPEDLDFSGEWTPEARTLLGAVSPDEGANPLLALWGKGPEGLGELFTMALRSQEDRGRVQTLLQEEIVRAIQASQAAQRWDAVEGMIARLQRGIYDRPVAERVPSARLVLDAIAAVQKAAPGFPSLFWVNWTAPFEALIQVTEKPPSSR